MSDLVRVYVNGRGVDAPADGTAVDAVRIADASLAERVLAADRMITDSRGLPVDAAARLYNGAIFRVVANRQHGAAAEDPSA